MQPTAADIPSTAKCIPPASTSQTSLSPTRRKKDRFNTEGIKYAGSKLNLLPAIIELAESTGAHSVFDGFCGTTRVSQAFAARGFTVTCNDRAVYSRVFAGCYLNARHEREHYQSLIDHLNSLSGYHGWYSEHYGGLATPEGSAVQPDGRRRPWQLHNTMKLDAIRDEIDRLNLDGHARDVALAALMLALDRVDNSLGHYAAYLKQWSTRSYQTMKLAVPAFKPTEHPHRVLSGDIFACLDNVNTDLAYLDPPYGSNNEKMPSSRVRYAGYYHIWTTICLNDRPLLFGRCGRRADTSDRLAASDFEEFRTDRQGRFTAVTAIEELLRRVNCRHIILSYSSGGRATFEQLLAAINSAGNLLEVKKLDHRRNVMASMSTTGDWVARDKRNTEYLFLIGKD